ncbi:Melanopsin [Aphelenchoides besseyi]|nr:Melanopsin [Aphelenchoides besseyi]KAI6210622.1 Melanopsin [Aphelenchoides besseyi]
MADPKRFLLNLSQDTTQDTILNDQTPSDRSCYESEKFIQFQYTVDDFLLAASTAATVFNVLVIFCAFRLFKRSGDTMHLFIINMTCGDLLLTVFCHPNEFLTRKHEFLRHVHLCAVIHFCNWLGLAVSGLSLTLLNVDKLIFFVWPLSYDQTMSKQRAAFLCLFIWSVSFGFVSYVWYEQIVYVTEDCMIHMSDNRRFFYEIFMILFCVLPVTSSLFVSIFLFRLTRQKRSPPVIVDGNQMDMPTFKDKVKSLVFIFATTAWTSFSLLPYRIFNICRIHLFDWNSISCEQREIMNWLAWMLLYLLTVNPIVNPLITAIIYAPYRMTLRRLLINFPIGNRLQYTYRGNDYTETSFLSTVRHPNRGGQTRNRRQRSCCVNDQELAEMGISAGSALRSGFGNSSTGSSSTNKESVDALTNEGNGRGLRKSQTADETGELLSNGRVRFDTDSGAEDTDNELKEDGSARSQPEEPTQPIIVQPARASFRQKPNLHSSSSAEL